jgi:hypothetical protein
MRDFICIQYSILDIHIDSKENNVAMPMEETSVLVLKFKKSSHIDKISVITGVPNRLMLSMELNLKCTADLIMKKSFKLP